MDNLSYNISAGITYPISSPIGGGIDLMYWLYLDPVIFLKDRISTQPLGSVFSAGRPDDEGNIFGVNVPVVGSDDWVHHYGAYENLITYSEDFTQWLKTRSTVDQNVIIAPDGVQSADAILADTAPDTSHYIRKSPTLDDNCLYTYSKWFKIKDFDWCELFCLTQDGVSRFAYFDLLNGVTGKVSGATGLIEAKGNGWFLCSLTFNSSSGATPVSLRTHIAEADDDNLITGNIVGQGVYTWGGQLTKSAYRLPYIKTEGSTVTVSNNSGDEDEGNSFPIGSVLPDIDSDYWQEVDGVERVVNGDFETGDFTSWSNHDGCTINGSNQVVFDQALDPHPRLEQVLSGISVGDNIELNYDVISNSMVGGQFYTYAGGLSSASIPLLSTVGHHRININVDNSNLFYPRYIGPSSGQFIADNFSIKQIEPSTAWTTCGANLYTALSGAGDGTTLNSGNLVATTRYVIISTETDHFGSGAVVGDHISGLTTALDANNTVQVLLDATGELVLDWMPMFDYGDTTGADVIVSFNNSITSGISHNLFGRIILRDGTNTLDDADVDWVAEIKYEIHAIWGDHPTEGTGKMQLIVHKIVDDEIDQTWESSIVDFDGSFNPGDCLKFAYDNPYWQKTKKLKIYKEPQSW